MNRELNELLNSVKRAMWSISATADIDPQGAKVTAAEVCTAIADYQARVKMAEESTDANRYALATLPALNYAHDGEDGDEGERVRRSLGGADYMREERGE